MIILLGLAYLIKGFYNKEKIWLISERGTDARDNGYHLFEYIRKNHPEIKIYYIIDKKSADRKKVEEIGDIVFYRSFKHYVYFLLAEKLISTHIMGYSPEPYLFTKLDKIIKFKAKKIFLQHGIIKDNIESLYSENVNLDLFVCGAYPEYMDIKSKYGFKEGVVKYLGLCRYDNLFTNNPQRQILLMPTWRMNINSLTAEKFKETEYFKCWNGIINNDILIKALKKAECNLIFYLHYEFQKYLDCFDKKENVILAHFSDYDVQKLLKDSALLVTDYSSVYFDFAYMKKPLIYYQFDLNEFQKNQYAKGYFDYNTMGFGKVVTEESKLVNEILENIENAFKIDTMFEKRTDEFFKIRDSKNCERNFNTIKDI